MRVEEIVTQQYMEIEEKLRAINLRINEIGEWHVIYKKIRGKTFPYRIIDGREYYLNKEKYETSKKKIKLYHVLYTEKKSLESEQEKYRKIFRSLKINEDEVQDRYRKAVKERKEHEEKIQQELLNAIDKPFSEGCHIATFNGDLVRSKSEMLIANALFEKNIHYEYEKPLELNGTSYWPDFTIYWQKQVFYWEHCGMMDDTEYMRKWHSKESVYQENGITQANRLIVTVETKDHPLSQNKINSVIEEWFGR